ncbi:MAG: response regulator [Firmicutes bacterium]|nr:response regulator [Bacillota bacterium]
MFTDESEAKILVVDDDPDTLEIIKIGLEFRSYDVITATNGEEALVKISSENPDLVVLDVMMPKIDGLEVCRRAKENFFTSQIPIILLTARGQVEDKVHGLSIGADDYLVKPFDMRELAARVEMILRRTKLSLEANPLTGLPGNIAIQREIDRRIKSAELFAVCYMDLDNFKAYNDRYGHSAGDQIIKSTAEIITSVFRTYGGEEDFVGHVGGDDFLSITTPELSEKLCMLVIDKFDAEVPGFYRPRDREKGYIQSFDRLGNLQKFPLMSISISIVTNEHREITHHAKVAQIAAELKKYAKSFEGSVFVKDRRKSDGIKIIDGEEVSDNSGEIILSDSD